MNLPAFRDWIVVPYYYHIENLPWDLERIEHLLYNLLIDFGISGELIVWMYFAIWFGCGVALSLVCFPKLYQTITQKQPPRLLITVLLVLLSLLNYWTLERLMMGQINVLRGHILFIPTWFSVQRLWSDSKPNTTQSWIIGVLAVTGLAIVSVHHVLLLIYVCLIFGICRFLKHCDILPYLRVFSVFIPAVLFQWYRYSRILSDTAFQIGQNNISTKLTIAQFFSLNSDHHNLVAQGILGKGSWMSPTFSEFERVRQSLGMFQNIFPYWNPWLIVGLFIVSVILTSYKMLRGGDTIAVFGIKETVFWDNNQTPVVLITTLALLLSFGLSSSFFWGINQRYFWTPFSYIMREPAKFYSLFLFGLLVLMCSLRSDVLERLRYVFLVVLVSNATLFILFFSRINTVSYPKIMIEMTKICALNTQILFLPDDTYFSADYSNDVFISQHWHFSTPCRISLPNSTRIQSNQIYLNKNSKSETINSITADPNCGSNTMSTIMGTFTELGYQGLLIDSSHSVEMRNFENCLNKDIQPKLKDGNISYYQW